MTKEVQEQRLEDYVLCDEDAQIVECGGSYWEWNCRGPVPIWETWSSWKVIVLLCEQVQYGMCQCEWGSGLKVCALQSLPLSTPFLNMSCSVYVFVCMRKNLNYPNDECTWVFCASVSYLHSNIHHTNVQQYDTMCEHKCVCVCAGVCGLQALPLLLPHVNMTSWSVCVCVCACACK